MTIEEMKKAKAALGYSYEKIADLAQMTPEGVRRIFLGKVQKPRLASMDALETVLRPYNVETYWEFMQERRCEMLDGVLYDVFLPSMTCQMLIGEMYTQIRRQLGEETPAGISLFAPVSVSLHGDLYTMTQPDVIVVRDVSRLKSWGILGAPDFVFEIIATSSQKKTQQLRLEHYIRAGVREYWVLDLHRKEITVYSSGETAEPVTYPLNGFLPIHIFCGDVVVDLQILSDIIDVYQRQEAEEQPEEKELPKTP